MKMGILRQPTAKPHIYMQGRHWFCVHKQADYRPKIIASGYRNTPTEAYLSWQNAHEWSRGEEAA